MVRTSPLPDFRQLSGTQPLLLDPSGCRMHEIPSLRVLWENSDFTGGLSNDGAHVLARSRNGGAAAILNARTGRCEFEFSRWRWPNLPKELVIVDARGCTEFLTWGVPMEGEPSKPEHRAVSMWRLRRPVDWYGFAWLPEFWITAVCAGGLVWSVMRGFRQKATA